MCAIFGESEFTQGKEMTAREVCRYCERLSGLDLIIVVERSADFCLHSSADIAVLELGKQRVQSLSDMCGSQ